MSFPESNHQPVPKTSPVPHPDPLRPIQLESHGKIVAHAKLPHKAGYPALVFWGARAFILTRSDQPLVACYVEADSWQLENVEAV
jgi:hypothetical protein